MIKENANQKEHTAYFVSLPIVETTLSQIPCLEVEIEGKKLLAELDLGFRGHITMPPEEVNHIDSKTFLGEKTMYGIRGKQYRKKKYCIPQLKIGAMNYSFPVLEEDNQEFLEDAIFIENTSEPASKKPEKTGRLGWELFFLTPLLIDIQNNQISFCDSLETLKNKGYAIETFTKVPLFLERGLVEFKSFTTKGPLRCILDTGSTWNILNEKIKEVNQAIWTPENRVESPFFLIENTNFGPISFHRMPIQIPIRVEAILGMEFFQTHLIFLDFKNHSAYFQKQITDP